MVGIYCITNKINGKKYIGQSLDIERRFRNHKKACHNIYLRRSVEKYGLDSFLFEILEEVSEELLEEKERYYIDLFNTRDPSKGYNLKDAGPHGELSADVKARMSKSRTGLKLSEDRKQKISEAMKGNRNASVPCSDDKKKKISEANKGRKRSEETRRKMSEKKLGKQGNAVGTIWVVNVLTKERKRIKTSELEKYEKLGFSKGYRINAD